MLAPAMQVAIGLLGLLLLYIAFFLTETAEGNIQNRLEALWITVDDLSKAALSRQAAFLQQVSRLLGAIFDRLFGKQLISAKAAATSICFSTAAPLLAFALIVAFDNDPPAWFSAAVILPLLGALILIAIGLAPVPIRYLAFVWVLVLVALLLYMHRDSLKGGVRTIVGDVLPILTVLAGSIACDILFISISRWYLRLGESMTSAWKILSMLIFNLLIGSLLLSPLAYALLAPGRMTDVRSMWGFLGASNLITALVPLLFAMLSLMAILHLAIWPLLQGPLYSVQRYGVVRQPKLLGSVGTICIVSAWPKSPVVQMISKLMHLA